jgi:DNA polymerase-3 subunit delta'
MKNDFLAILANDDLCNYFASSIRKNTLSHAFILLGPKGSGKHTLAKMIAASLNCEAKHNDELALPCTECDFCRKILNNNSADVIMISREDDRATLGVDPIRFIKEDVVYYPNDGDFKIYIIEDAHTMTLQAQNAFLLTLEEPPEYAVFILLCENIETILETIKSRAPILRMTTPSKEEAINYIKENNPSARNFITNSPEEFEEIYMASGGSIGRILELISSSERKQILQSREFTQKFIETIAHHTLSQNYAEISALFSQKREERERIVQQLAEIQCALRDLMVIKKSDNPRMVFFTDIQYAEELSYSFSMQKISDLIKSTEQARLALLRNANVKLTITNFLSGLI